MDEAVRSGGSISKLTSNAIVDKCEVLISI